MTLSKYSHFLSHWHYHSFLLCVLFEHIMLLLLSDSERISDRSDRVVYVSVKQNMVIIVCSDYCCFLRVPSEGEASGKSESPRWGFWRKTFCAGFRSECYLLKFSTLLTGALWENRKTRLATQSHAHCASRGAWRRHLPWSQATWCVKSAKR